MAEPTGTVRGVALIKYEVTQVRKIVVAAVTADDAFALARAQAGLRLAVTTRVTHDDVAGERHLTYSRLVVHTLASHVALPSVMPAETPYAYRAVKCDQGGRHNVSHPVQEQS